jgi:hypothetical protein
MEDPPWPDIVTPFSGRFGAFNQVMKFVSAPRRFIVHAERVANVSKRSHTTATQGGDTR